VISVGADDIDVLLCMEAGCSLAGRFLPRLLSVLFPIHSPLRSICLKSAFPPIRQQGSTSRQRNVARMGP